MEHEHIGHAMWWMLRKKFIVLHCMCH